MDISVKNLKFVFFLKIDDAEVCKTQSNFLIPNALNSAGRHWIFADNLPKFYNGFSVKDSKGQRIKYGWDEQGITFKKS
jgi:hypothetical protein